MCANMGVNTGVNEKYAELCDTPIDNSCLSYSLNTNGPHLNQRTVQKTGKFPRLISPTASPVLWPREIGASRFIFYAAFVYVSI